MGEAVDPPSQPLGFLGTLIEAARTKERGRALEAVRRDGAGDVGGAGVRHSRGNAVRGGFACDPRQDTPEQDGDGNVEFSVSLPSGSSAVPDSHDERGACSAAKHPLQMSREEFLAQFKRAPRRGEIGYDAASVAAAESLGYVMSGSRDREKQHYIDSIQHKLHEKEARKLRLHFRKVEDERNDSATVETLLALMRRKIMREERDE
uniref:Uncharacterized protein TCIL3000_10_10130 n=1 Tax=Trypanosoma congolense (strain IL3000) TaxID=1068625 RepID=G0UXW7_TRYCI|nr:unnamed protein product [Trypanosoma congolense IL3000]